MDGHNIHIVLQITFGSYTADESFLSTKLYPLLKETEKVVRHILIEDSNGYLTLPLTSSPEIDNDEPNAWFKSITNYDLALLRFLYEALIEFAPIICPKDLSEWKKIYERLPELAVENGIGFKLSADRCLTESHRHFSHLMSIYPLNQCCYTHSKQEKKIIDDSIALLETLGRKVWIGFSFTWMAHLYAFALNGEAAVEQLRDFFMHLCSQNGFHLNGDFRRAGITNYSYRPFTLESNMNAADAIQEMLMQCYDDIIRLFPAIPAEWKKEGCEFNGFLSYGNIKISSKIEDDKVLYIKLCPKRTTECRIYNPFNVDEINVESANVKYKLHSKDGILTILLEKEKEYILSV